MGKKINRRDFLALMGLGGAAAVTVSCGRGEDYFEEKWHPWTEPVAGMVPYVPRHYATTTRESGGCGLWVKVVDGRAIKVNGNPGHPLNKGTLTARQQSTIQDLYSADRLYQPLKNGQEVTWKAARKELAEKLAGAWGRNVTLLTGPMTGAVEKFWTQVVSSAGNGKVVQYSAFSESDMVIASEKAFDQSGAPLFSLKGADFVCSLGAQFLETWGEVNANSRYYAEMRRVEGSKRHGKHVQVEAKMSMTGASADQCLHAAPGSETVLALALLKLVAEHSKHLSADEQAKVASMTANVSIEAAVKATGLNKDQISKLAAELGHAHSGVVLPAERLALGDDVVAHNVAVLLLNKALGGIGTHVNYSAAKPAERVHSHKAISDLIADLNANKVDLLLIMGTNPVYSLPADLKFAEAVKKAASSIAFASTSNETTALADVTIPVAHELESWGEVNTYTGIDMLQQPVMRTRRYEVIQAEDEILGAVPALGGDKNFGIEGDFMTYLKTDWLSRFGGGDKEWREALKTGGSFTLAESGENLAVSANLDVSMFGSITARTAPLSLVLVESARFGDGSFANRAWLQELPDTMTGVTWDSWLEVSKHKAEELGLDYGQNVEIQANNQTLTLPVFIAETNADNVVTLATGLGRTVIGGTYARGVNAFTMLNKTLNAAEQYSAGPMSVQIKKAAGKEIMATFHVPTKGDRVTTHLSEDYVKLEHPGNYQRTLWQKIDSSSLGGHGHGGGHHEERDPDSKFPMYIDNNFYRDRTETSVVVGRDETFYDNYKWEMAIDLNKCNGCGSCVVSCYAENNLPTVGKDQVAKGREMAWIRINRYLEFANDHGHGEGHGDDGHNPVTAVGFLPMMCQQCGNAPCESVCPSLATYHTKEGLNAMVYNRCVGTRYCSNNCSYKVRRYNWFDYGFEGEAEYQLNPEVGVRSRGVMEKCTFCVHRVRTAKDMAKDNGRKVNDGEMVTACQEACPSGAISFGNYSDENSEVYKLAHDERAYRALDDHIRTKPGVSYLKRVVLGKDNGHHG